ncbi:MAG: hypothetical protein IKN09_05075 [Clostridia bacterium]|nr:hypothetical protein [Clostridia bacterium]MBR4261294.1 hypothetical protein [Clostridia bacterium]
MVAYNKGRFIFMFEPATRCLSAVFDTKYEGFYQLNFSGFLDVFKIAVESLDDDAVEALKERLKEEPQYVNIISKVQSSRNNLTVE